MIEADGDDVGCYELATSFIDAELMEAVKSGGDTPVRQVGFFTNFDRARVRPIDFLREFVSVERMLLPAYILYSLFVHLQVVLLTDGMDTRPYRLPWPSATTVFDVSPSATHNVAAERLEGRRLQRLYLISKVNGTGLWEFRSNRTS